MLELLHIENIAVIELADIAFRPGFNALTGETGAGKSNVIDARERDFGGRTSRVLFRTGADNAFVSAIFSDVPQILPALPKTVRPRMRMAILRSSARSAVRGKAFAA